MCGVSTQRPYLVKSFVANACMFTIYGREFYMYLIIVYFFILKEINLIHHSQAE